MYLFTDDPTCYDELRTRIASGKIVRTQFGDHREIQTEYNQQQMAGKSHH